MTGKLFRSSISVLFVLCISLGSVETIVGHFLADHGVDIEALIDAAGEEDKEEKNEKEKTEKDKFFSRSLTEQKVTETSVTTTLSVQSEHQFESEVEIPPPENIFS